MSILLSGCEYLQSLLPISPYGPYEDYENQLNTHHQLPLSIDAFMDDMWLPAPNLQNLPRNELALQAQTNLQKWHGILQSSGSQLNLKKCMWMLFHWMHKPSGEARISVPSLPPVITTTITGSEPYAIRCLTPTKAHHYLGIQLTTDGNTKQELKIFQEPHVTHSSCINACSQPEKPEWSISNAICLCSVTHCLPHPFPWKNSSKSRDRLPAHSYQKWDTPAPSPEPSPMPHNIVEAWAFDI